MCSLFYKPLKVLAEKLLHSFYETFLQNLVTNTQVWVYQDSSHGRNIRKGLGRLLDKLLGKQEELRSFPEMNSLSSTNSQVHTSIIYPMI